jgi:PAS domain S-box-containing protein
LASGKGKKRSFGIELVGEISWGTHLCQFYQNEQDLIDILVPYFTQGLRSREFCMWITSPPLEAQEAKKALTKAIPNLAYYLRKGQIEIISYSDWYLRDGNFDAAQVLDGWIAKEKDALKRGFDGLRLSGNTFWVERDLWQTFVDYEEAINSVIVDHKMIALCTYCLAKCTGSDVLDVIRNHAGTLLKQGDKWSIVEDILHRKKTEETLRRLNRTLRAISNSNQALMRATDEETFLREGCRILVEDCGYAMVWVGFARDDSVKSVEPVAYAGFDKAYVDMLNVTWADTKRGHGPTGRAIRTGQPQLCQDMNTDPRFRPWRKEALKRGYRSSIALPLKSADKTFGAITLYSKDANVCIAADEMKLLTELATDLAYGITMLRLRKEREQAEEKVNKQAALIDLSPDSIIVRSLDGTISFWSKGAENLYGWTKEEVVGKNINSILQTMCIESFNDIVVELKQKGHWSGELIHQTKSSRTVVVQSYWLAKFDENGQVLELMESNVDITDRKQMQTKLEGYAAHLEELVQERTQQLKETERLTAIGETAGMVGHDLRNPLQTVTGETYLAKTELKDLPDSPAKRNLEETINTIAEQIGYMDKIVSDLQDFVRPISADKKVTDLNKLLIGTLAELKAPKNVVTKLEIDALPAVFADGQLLKRLFFNLFNNAVQAMPEGGVLTIKARKTGVGNGNVCIHVVDTGEGIPDCVKPKIFKPLFTTKSKGQGFGLAVCKRVIEAHGGTINFESTEGQGTKFTIEFPINGANTKTS